MTLLEIRTAIGCTQAHMAERMGLSLRAYQRPELHGPVKQVHILAARYIQLLEAAPALNDVYSAQRTAYRESHPVVVSRDV